MAKLSKAFLHAADVVTSLQDHRCNDPDNKVGITVAALATRRTRWDNDYMKIAIELNATQSEQLQAIAAALGVAAEELAKAAVADLVNNDADDFEAAALRVLQKNRELYRRLS